MKKFFYALLAMATLAAVPWSASAQDCDESVTLPYSTNFDDLATGGLPACWTAVQSGSNGSYGPFPSAYAYADNARSGGVYFEMESGSSETELVALPRMENVSSLMLTFWASAQSYYLPALFEVGVLEADDGFTPVDTISFVTSSSWGSGYHQYTVYFANYEGDGDRIALRATGASGQYTLMFDDFEVAEFSGCYPLRDLRLAEALDESITIAWTDHLNYSPDYIVRYCEAGSTDTTEETVYETSFTALGLESSTEYWFEVKADCGSGSTPALAATYRTACAARAIPFSEGFEDADALECWTLSNCVNNTGRYIGQANGGDTCFRFRYTSYPPQYLVSPLLSGTENGVKVSFRYKVSQPSDPESFKVGYSTTTSDIESFTWFDEQTHLTNTAYAEYSEVCPAGTRYVAIAHTSNYAYFLYIDDVTFSLPPDCLPVAGLYVDEVGANGATLHWDANPDVNSFQLTYDDEEFFNTTDTFYTFTGLDPTTAYTVKVAPECGDGVIEWRTLTFNTDCEGGSCQVSIVTNSDYGAWGDVYRPVVDVVQNGAVMGSVNGSAAVNVCAGVPVSFVYTEPIDTWIETATVVIADGAGNEVFNANTLSRVTGDTLLVLANGCPTCMAPSGLVADNVDSVSVSFSWTVDDEVYGYVVSFDGSDWVENTNGLYEADNLQPNTLHTLSVRTVCDASDDTSNVRSITVRTTCGQMVLPYSTSFEDNEAGEMPTCWYQLGATGTDYYGIAYPAVDTEEPHTGSNALRFYAIGDISYATTSAIPLPGNQIYVSFYANTYNGYYEDTLQAGILTDLGDVSTFVPFVTLDGTNDYTMYEFNTSTLVDDPDVSYYLAFRWNSNYAYNFASIDDVLIREDNGCMHPSQVLATPDAHSVQLDWANSGTISNFVVKQMGDDGQTWGAPVEVNDAPYAVTGLDAATAYTFAVGNVCSAGDTLWVVLSVTTTCDQLPLPYEEDFDSYGNSLPPCWTLANASGVTYFDGGLFFRSNYGGAENYAVMPRLDGNLAKLQIDLDVKVGNYSIDQDGILLGVADAAGNLLAWLDTLRDADNSRNAFVHYTIQMLNYVLPAGADRLVFAQMRNYGEWALIDNINISALPDCYPVTNLVGQNLIDPENTVFTWVPLGNEGSWQVYVDTVTVGIDDLADLPASSFTTVYQPSYAIPAGDIIGGGVYNIFVRSDCGDLQGNWVTTEFGAGAFVMNNSSVADTITGCGFVIYDNGGPVAGYHENSNSALVVRTANEGMQLEIFGGKFGFGSSSATLTVYDGEGTSGAVLYTYNTVDGRDTLPTTVLATSTTGSLTITFESNGNMCHTGYELYIHCVGEALCARPTLVRTTSVTTTSADLSWSGEALSYDVYYREQDAASWNQQTVYTNGISLDALSAGTAYELYVVAICSATDTSSATNVYHFSTPATDGIGDAFLGQVSLYPNPATAEVTVTFEGEAVVSLIDQCGREVQRTRGTAGASLDVSRLPRGTYFVRVTAGQGTAVRKLIVR